MLHQIRFSCAEHATTPTGFQVAQFQGSIGGGGTAQDGCWPEQWFEPGFRRRIIGAQPAASGWQRPAPCRQELGGPISQLGDPSESTSACHDQARH